MGLFSGIKKAVKRIFKGVKKVFKKVGTFVSKVLDSKLGKAIMLAVAVYTGGAALGAWGGGAAAGASTGQTFLSKFVTGAKDFMGGMFGQGGGAAAQAAGGAATAAGPAAGAAAGAAIPTTVAPAISGAAQAGGVAGKMLSGAKNFLTSPGGGIVAANVMQGLAQGKMAEEEREYNHGWGDPKRLGQLEAAADRTPQPRVGNLLERSKRVAREQTSVPSVGFRSAPMTGV